MGCSASGNSSSDSRPPLGPAPPLRDGDDTQKTSDEKRKAVDYDSPTSLWEALESKDVLLVRGTWLMQLAKNDGTLPRRQDCPREAFASLEELKSIYEDSSAKPKYANQKRVPIVAVSHFWRTPGHPDPEGITLSTIVKALEEYMPEFMKYGILEVGVFFDWASLYQEPRTDVELDSFKKSMKFINLWYAHALTTAFLVTDTPKGLVAYYDRGWTTFEYQLSWLIKLADKDNVWPQVADLGKGKRGRPSPVEPDAFWEGHMFGDKRFTNGFDREKVARRFRETCEDVFGSVTELDFDSLGWGNEDMDRLDEVLYLCQQLKIIYLNNNVMTCLPDSIGKLHACETLSMNGCNSLTSLPESIGQLQALKELWLEDCSSLASLPESIGQLQACTFLTLENCSSLTRLPESIGQLQACEMLVLRGCSALRNLPESIAQLTGCDVYKPEHHE